MKLMGLMAEGEAAPSLDAACELWPADEGGNVLCARPPDGRARDSAEAALAGTVSPLLRVREVLHWDELGDAPETVALVYFVRRREGLSYADFEAHYRERHAPLARVHHPGIARYVQNFLAEPAGGESTAGSAGGAHAIDAVSELWFRSERDARERFYRDAESERVIAGDVARFLAPRAGIMRFTRPGSGVRRHTEGG